jgi:ribulose-phosphate 3-epimerase
MNTAPVVPAVIPPSREAILAYAEQLSFSPEFQLDLVDGKFVDSVSWPYQPAGEPLSVKSQLDCYTLEVDLMVVEQLKAAKEWEEAGADMLVFHIESLPLDGFLDFCESTSVSVGVSAHGATTIDELARYAEHADYIQLMGIYEIGAQGLPFDERVLGKIEELKRRFPEKMISIDGSVNKNTINRLRDAGADRFICGSAIVLQPDPEAAWNELMKLAAKEVV